MNISFVSFHTYRPFLPAAVPRLLYATLSFMVGIIGAYFHQYWLIPVALSLPALIALSLKKKISLTPYFYLFFFCTGFLKTDTFLHYRATLFPLWHTSIEATVENITFVESKTWRYQILLKVDKYFDTNSWKEKPFVLQLYTHKKPTFKVADTVHCALDHIGAPDGDFKLYLYKEGIDATAFQGIVTSKIIKRPAYSWKRWVSQKKRMLHYRLLKKMNTPTFALFSSLFMGNRTSVKQELEPQKPLFKVWGIAHFLARSGLHLLIFIAILSKLLQYVPAPFLVKQGILFIIALFYFLFSWNAVSFNRAFYTFLFYKFATFLSIPFHSMHALSFICLLILIENPLHLFFLDFQLTFLLTFCLIWIAHIHHQRRLLYPQSIAQLREKTLS